MKLFSHKKTTWATLTREAPNFGGISQSSVQMKQVAGLNNAITQLETMKAFKSDAQKESKAIDVLMQCKSQIMRVIQPSASLSSSDQGPSVRRP